MILVIADDFTGAAEMAGICLGYGLKVSLCLGSLTDCNAEVLVISTDSRSMKKEAALSVVERITLQALQMKPDFVYKKIDSVLRGFVSEELTLQLNIFGLTKALVLPANPSLGRVIKNGQYFVEGIDISKTGFAKDPEFAITTPDVRQMLRTGNANILKRGDMPGDGINIGEAGDLSDVQHWAEQVNEECLPAGSGDFFNAILNRKYREKERNVPPILQKPHLYVSGTSFAKNRALIKSAG
ncbi:MAG TPA: four-carbon acid sugar kinase family protein, partial [Niabella sp.]|nr:four-carbon acid sugar kinase family protein [Niabella sp.]